MDWLCNTSGSFLSFVPCLLLVLYINPSSSWVLPSWNSLEYIEFASYPSSHLLVPIPDVQRPLVLPRFLTTCPFQHIHSDLKSFSVELYHQYRYLISYLDDFTSIA